MIPSYHIAVMGGDKRMQFLCHTLCQAGHRVTAYRVPDYPSTDDWQGLLEESEILILPLPMTQDGVRLLAYDTEGELPLRLSLIADRFRGRVILGGKIPDSFLARLRERDMQVIDYYDNEVLQLKNAVPSAEGAICLAMGELPVTLDGTVAGVIGYGRIGQLLSERLRAMGAQVKVFARRQESLVAASLAHHRPVPLKKDEGYSHLLREASDCRVLFNTVPHPILTAERLRTLPQDCLLIDLASAPGGIDIKAAKGMGFRAFWATALPGRCYPESAGRILGESLLTLLDGISIP